MAASLHLFHQDLNRLVAGIFMKEIVLFKVSIGICDHALSGAMSAIGPSGHRNVMTALISVASVTECLQIQRGLFQLLLPLALLLSHDDGWLTCANSSYVNWRGQ